MGYLISRGCHMSIYLTGDTHGELSINRLSFGKWPEGKNLVDTDYLIIAGDFGLIFRPEQTSAEKYWLNWLNDRPWTTLIVDGNHDNHIKLQELPREEKFGGIVGKIANSIYHLRRGEIYLIEGKKVLTFGGADSIDKENRLDGITWWKEEIPNYAEMDNCIENMKKHQEKVDIIVAHTCPLFLAQMLAAKQGFYSTRNADPTTKMLEHIVKTCAFEDFYCGHWHIDEDHGKYHFVYERILKI